MMASVVVSMILGLVAFVGEASAGLPPAMTFDSTGGEQSYVVPAGVTTVRVEAVGGKGAHGYWATLPSGATGGFGADVVAALAVSAGERLYVEVGGNAPNDKSGAGGF
jgi:hypothetical protein